MSVGHTTGLEAPFADGKGPRRMIQPEPRLEPLFTDPVLIGRHRCSLRWMRSSVVRLN
jgi:hypothetical protein